jgi:transcriptional regulator with XRE-family HTH domain
VNLGTILRARMRALLTKRGITVQQLAELDGVAKSTIHRKLPPSMAERDASALTVEDLDRWCTLIGADPASLLAAVLTEPQAQVLRWAKSSMTIERTTSEAGRMFRGARAAIAGLVDQGLITLSSEADPVIRPTLAGNNL